MYLAVSPTGLITFRYDYRLNGRRETLTIGRYGASGLSLARARENALRRQARGRRGQSHPRMCKQREKRGPARRKQRALGSSANGGFRGRMADSTRAMRRAIFERDILPTFRNRLLTEITSGDVRVLCAKVKERGAPATAVHVQGHHQARLWLRDPARRKGGQPRRGGRTPRRSRPLLPRDRSLSPAEIRIMLQSTRTCANAANGSGSKSNSSCWPSGSQERTAGRHLGRGRLREPLFWSIPKERMKRSKPHNVYLSQQTFGHHGSR